MLSLVRVFTGVWPFFLAGVCFALSPTPFLSLGCGCLFCGLFVGCPSLVLLSFLTQWFELGLGCCGVVFVVVLLVLFFVVLLFFLCLLSTYALSP